MNGFSDTDWHALEQSAKEGNIIPIIGSDALMVEYMSQIVPFYRLVTSDLLKSFQIDPESNPDIMQHTTGEQIGQPLKNHKSIITNVAFSQNGERIVSGSLDKILRLWDANTGTPIGKPLRNQKSGIINVTFSSDDKHIISISENHILQFWNITTGKPTHQHIFLPQSKSVAFSPDGTRIALGDSNKILGLWDIAADKPKGNCLQAL